MTNEERARDLGKRAGRVYGLIESQLREPTVNLWCQAPRIQLDDLFRPEYDHVVGLRVGLPGAGVVPERWYTRETFAWLEAFFEDMPPTLAPQRASVRLRAADLPRRQALRNVGYSDGDIYHAGVVDRMTTILNHPDYGAKK